MTDYSGVDNLAKDFSGVILNKKSMAMLAVRICSLIDLAVAEERKRCHDLAQDTTARILCADKN